MSRILLLLDNKEDRRLLAEWLSSKYQVLIPDSEQALDRPFDLCIMDGTNLDRLWEWVQARKEAEQPVFSPFLLATSRQNVGMATGYLYQSIDEVIITPIEKLELQARLEILLRTRQGSLELKIRNDELGAFINAMTHDLRAPVRIITSFTQALFEDEADKLDEQGRHYLERIQSATEQARELIDSLLAFARLGRGAVSLQAVELQSVVERILRDLQEEIQTENAQISISGELPVVRVDPALLRIALTNLISNAIKFVAPGTQPQVSISSLVMHDICNIQVRDNGIGIAPENQQRIFEPFVRLHGVEEYPGIGLGLSSVRKAIELMGGRVGVKSRPGEGSIFWVELSCGEAG